MNSTELIDLILNELVNTNQPSISVNRIIRERKVSGISEAEIKELEHILVTKSLVKEKGQDSQGFKTFALSETGRDFLKQFGSYAKYLKGLRKEERRTEKSKEKKPYKTTAFKQGEAPTPYSPPEKSFLQKNIIGLIILALFMVLFYVIANI